MIFNIAALLMALTAFLHSFFGERRLIMPMLAIDAPLFKSALARWVIRAAWHFTSLLMFVTAWPVLDASIRPDAADRTLLFLIGITWLMVGLIDAVGSKGKHIGWPPLTLAGFLILFPLLTKG